MPIVLPTHPWHLIRNINLFIFVTDLMKSQNNYVYRSFLYAKVNDYNHGEIIDRENMITRIENIYTPPRLFSNLTFGVLGMEQFDFFESIWPNALFVNVLHPTLLIMEPEKIMHEDGFGLSGKELVFYSARRIEMFQNILCDTSNNLSIQEENFMRDEDVFKKIHILLHADQLTDQTFPKNIQYKSIIAAPICKNGEVQFSIEQFTDSKQLLDYLELHYSEEKILNIAVFGKEEHEFFENILNTENQCKKIVDISYRIPSNIDYICRNVQHAIYHARRIEALQAFLKNVIKSLR